ncbi:MAG: hypothetical protein IPF88_08270 [Candidatus Microthrix sp.]|nr:hypothetical protein [Candidatus Microthrix sp.]MBK6438578.1 hypothetical protein [Candidatus Microthrix sp.]MBK6969062.1 hypothetical protein [Candidatus Microthrix sp.]MBP7594706.1 hypothetical protein [Candidatus Microthrix sp.]
MRASRIASGLTQADLAERSGVAAPTSSPMSPHGASRSFATHSTF